MMNLFPRQCTITGKGFSEGFLVGDDYAIDQKSADELAKRYGYTSYVDAHNEDEDFAYWTEWSEDDCYEQGFAYTEEGQVIYFTTQNVLDEIKKAINDEIKDLEGYISGRAKENDFEGEEDELYDMDLSSDELLNWSTEDRENHSFDLGALIRLKDVRDKVESIENNLPEKLQRS